MGFMARKFIDLMWKLIGKADQKRLSSQTPTPGVSGDRDIPYLEDGDVMHLLDVYYPEGTDCLLPVIVDVHGGGWVYGTKEINEYFCMSLSSRGFAVANINYRLAPGTDLKGQVDDVLGALHWLGEHGAEHHCDLESVFIMGDSAGGHLSSLCAAIVADPYLCERYGTTQMPYEIRGVEVNHTAPDVRDKMFGMKGIDREMLRLLFGDNPAGNPIYDISTIYDTAKAETYPPILVVTSKADPLHTHSLQLMDYLREKGFRCELAMPDENGPNVSKLSHVFNVTDPYCEEGREINDRIAEFFKAI